jgi:hypothetical protein
MERTEDGLAIFTDIDDALVWIVHKLGGFKKVGTQLRPELNHKPDLAAQWLRDCLNPDKRERLNPQQTFLLLTLARQGGFHAAKYWIDDELGYERGRPVTVEDEAARLQRQIVDATQVLKQSLDRLERLQRPPLQSITGGQA